MRTLTCLGVLLFALGCSERAPRERPRADVPAVQVVASVDAMPLVEVRAREPNDTWETSTPLNVGEEAHDAVGDVKDRDVFSLTIERPRVVAVTLSALAKTDLVLELADSAGVVLAVSDCGPANTVERLPNLSLPPGRYAISVSQFVRKPARNRKRSKAAAVPPDALDAPAVTEEEAAYTVTVTDAVVGFDEEREPNDQAGQASVLGLAESKKGYIGWRGDVDLWQLKTEGLGVDNLIDIQIQGAPGVSYTVDVVGPTEADRIASRTMKAAGPFFLHSLPLTTGVAWLRVTGTPSNPQTAYEIQFVARYVEAAGEAMAERVAIAESEPNDTAERATSVPEGGVVAMLDHGDVDIFRVPAQEAAGWVSFEPSAGLDISVEEMPAGGVARVTNAGTFGESERVQMAAGRDAIFVVRAVRRRGTATPGGDEATYHVAVVEADPAGAVPAPDPAVAEPHP